MENLCVSIAWPFLDIDYYIVWIWTRIRRLIVWTKKTVNLYRFINIRFAQAIQSGEQSAICSRFPNHIKRRGVHWARFGVIFIKRIVSIPDKRFGSIEASKCVEINMFLWCKIMLVHAFRMNSH